MQSKEQSFKHEWALSDNSCEQPESHNSKLLIACESVGFVPDFRGIGLFPFIGSGVIPGTGFYRGPIKPDEAFFNFLFVTFINREPQTGTVGK